MRLRREKRYLATFSHGGETVDVRVRARGAEEAERRAKTLVAEGWNTALVQVRRESWSAYARRTRATAPTPGEHERRVFAMTLLAGGFVIVAAVFVAAAASSVTA
jgi:hypothetical protein